MAANEFMKFVRHSIGSAMQRIGELQSELAAMKASNNVVAALLKQQQNVTSEIDKIPGRRIFYNLTGTQTFTDADNGNRGQPVTMLVSQDGPFIATHYPFVVWQATAPDTTTLFGHWRPVSAWPLPDQATGGGLDFNRDILSISYEITDGGSQRNFQNEPSAPVFSRPDNLVPLPSPTLYTPNTSIQWFPTYEQISFTSDDPPTEGTIKVTLPGYRIVNL